MNMGVLPTIKCSNCGCNVEIMSMGDHTCIQNDSAVVSVPSPPSPPPSAGLESPDRLTTAMASKIPRGGPPPRIDPYAANRAYLQPNMPTPASSVAPSPSINSAPRSPLYPPHDAADNESTIDLDNVFSFPMPGNRSPTQVRTPSPMTMPQGTGRSLPPALSPGLGLGLRPENIQLPPSPMPPSMSPEPNHYRGDSTVSHSSYRTSFASSRYGESTARSSTNSFSRGQRSFMEEPLPVPLAPLRTPNKTSFPRDSNLSVVSSQISEEEASGFDFGLPTGSNPVTGLQDLPEESPSVEYENNDEYPAFQPTQTDLRPATAATEPSSVAQRKNSDASTTSLLSVTSFARALGLEEQMNNPESSVSSESSPSDARSGSSMSSIPSDVSLTRLKPSDPLTLAPMVEELPPRTRQTVLEIPGRIRSTMEDLNSVENVPPIPAAFFSPDSPTDPSINKGGLSLIADRQEAIPIPSPTPSHPKQSTSPQPPQQYRAPQRSFTAPIPQTTHTPQVPTRSGTRSKGTCRGCNETITGKSISSSDGRLTGRYHRGCFVCFECHSPFQTVDFYVLNNRPFCAQHYHERNGSLCTVCNTGIEGHYLETVERNPGRSDRRRFHTECLQCRTCHVLLKGDYFEWNGEVFCERDARRAAAASYHPPPPGRRRPTLGSSPLAQSGQFPPVPYPRSAGPGPGPGHGPGGLRSGPRYPPGGGGGGGGGRFPERRTTKLMMI
ncbi:Zinc finger LIM-type [Penicillium soppii]|uniref:Zinc finger LIM-type n=1 Tax=Penicillium soppii TaxID=69789 RepID=UPI002546CD59|nr:Zinc finger LIM-type [Penicillium soppii]KAJ5855370.1 Zinc finger LIM-type [Penicillium soppii]